MLLCIIALAQIIFTLPTDIFIAKSEDVTMENISKDITNIQRILDRGDEIISNEQLAEALNLPEGIHKNASDHSKALFLNSVITCIQGDKEKSFNLFNEFLVDVFGEDAATDEEYAPIDENDPEDMFQCGMAEFIMFRDYSRAIEYFDQSLRLNPNQSMALYYKARSFAKLGWLKKAVKVLDKAIALDGDNVRYLHDRGVFLSKLKQISKAHKSFDKAIEVMPNSYSWSNKGALYLQAGRFDDALHCFDEAIELDQEYISPVVGKALIYSAWGDDEMAEKYFDMAEKIDDEDIEYLAQRGIYLLEKSEFKKSIEYFDRCLEADDKLASVWMYKSMALSEIGMDVKSEECFKTAMDLDPDTINLFDDVLIIEE